MKIRFFLCACVLLLGFAAAGSADEATDQYSMLMKPAVAANAALQKVVASDLAATATNATDVQNAFAKIEEFWAKRGVADAQGFAKNVQAAAKEVHDAAAAGNGDAAQAAAKKLGPNCGMCHMAHRDKAADGSWLLK